MPERQWFGSRVLDSDTDEDDQDGQGAETGHDAEAGHDAEIVYDAEAAASGDEDSAEPPTKRIRLTSPDDW